MERPEKRCHFCETKESPLWRKDKDTGRTLCNACGLYIQRAKKRNSPDSPMKRRSASIPSGLPAIAPYEPYLRTGTTHHFTSNQSHTEVVKAPERSGTLLLKPNAFSVERSKLDHKGDADLLKMLAIEADKETYTIYKMPKFYRQQYATVPRLVRSHQTLKVKVLPSVHESGLVRAAPGKPVVDKSVETRPGGLEAAPEHSKNTSVRLPLPEQLMTGHPAGVATSTVKSGSIVEYFASDCAPDPDNVLYAIIQHILLDTNGEVFFLPIPLKPRIAHRRGTGIRMEDLEVEPNIRTHIENQPITYSMLQPIACINKIIVY